QRRLEGAGGGLRAPGESVILSCRGSGFNFDYYDIWWYRQAPRGILEWVSVISEDSTIVYFDQTMQNRTTVSRDNSQSEAYLSVHYLQPSDSARYFCAIHS
ncbi:HV03 protein, partial [Grantiella picta]|nr:HV03 protein [Grantiella picta]